MVPDTNMKAAESLERMELSCLFPIVLDTGSKESR